MRGAAALGVWPCRRDKVEAGRAGRRYRQEPDNKPFGEQLIFRRTYRPNDGQTGRRLRWATGAINPDSVAAGRRKTAIQPSRPISRAQCPNFQPPKSPTLCQQCQLLCCCLPFIHVIPVTTAHLPLFHLRQRWPLRLCRMTCYTDAFFCRWPPPKWPHCIGRGVILYSSQRHCCALPRRWATLTTHPWTVSQPVNGRPPRRPSWARPALRPTTAALPSAPVIRCSMQIQRRRRRTVPSISSLCLQVNGRCCARDTIAAVDRGRWTFRSTTV